MTILLLATVFAAYGIWYGAFARDFPQVHPFTGRTIRRYKPRLWQRVMVWAVGVFILIAAVAEIKGLWK